MTEKVRMRMDDVAQLVHHTLVIQAAKMVDAGAPHEVVVGELIKLAIKAAVHLRGKKKGQHDVQDLVKRCFAAIGPEEEARLRRGRPH
jgi:hypothetical protein